MMRSWFEKQRCMMDFTLSALVRRKGRNAALLLIYVVIVFLPASVMFLTHALKKEAALILKNAPEITVQRMEAGRHAPMPRNRLASLAAIRGVSTVQGRLWGYYFDPVVGANYTVLGQKDFPHAAGGMIVGTGLSTSRLVYPGDLFALGSSKGAMVPFTVRGVLAPESELVSADLILVSEKDFSRLFGTAPEFVTDITLSVKNEREVATVAEKIHRLFPDTRVITRSEILRTYDSIFDWRNGLVVLILSLSALAFSILAWDKASGLSAEEKKEIGILKAIGWETSDILLMKFWEGALLSLTAFLSGVLLAYGHVFLTSAFLFEPVLKGWSVLYPEFKLVPFIDMYQLATLFLLIVAPYTVATIVPSWRAACMDPDTVMRT